MGAPFCFNRFTVTPLALIWSAVSPAATNWVIRVWPMRSIGSCLDKSLMYLTPFFPPQNVQHGREPIDLVLLQNHFVFPERREQIFITFRQVLRRDKFRVV